MSYLYCTIHEITKRKLYLRHPSFNSPLTKLSRFAATRNTSEQIGLENQTTVSGPIRNRALPFLALPCGKSPSSLGCAATCGLFAFRKICELQGPENPILYSGPLSHLSNTPFRVKRLADISYAS